MMYGYRVFLDLCEYSEELAELRAKLTRKHDEDYYSATAILTEQKDIAFKEAEQKWSQEIGVLIEKVRRN